MNVLELNDLIDNWTKDAEINKIDPDSDILKIPNLHSKYASQIVLHNGALRIKRILYNELLRIKTHYYSGKLDKDTLKNRNWEPFLDRISGKNELDSYLLADPELNKVKSEMGLHEDAINFCEMVVKELNNRTWQIKSYLDYSKYKIGV